MKTNIISTATNNTIDIVRNNLKRSGRGKGGNRRLIPIAAEATGDGISSGSARARATANFNKYINSINFKKQKDIIKTHHVRIRRGRGGRGRPRKWKEGRIQRANALAKKLDFKNEREFRQFIDTVSEKSKDGRLLKIYNYLFKVAKENPKSIAKIAIAGGSIATMVVYLKNYQKKRTGCFRYIRGQMDTEPKKIMGNYCVNNDNDNDNDNDENVIPEAEHPLHGVNKWNCNDNLFSNSIDPAVNHILSLGCHGLCDWRNYNTLASIAKDFEPIVIDPKHTQDDEYVYKCERITILRALASNVGAVFNETFSGLMDSSIGRKIARAVFLFALVITMLLLYSSVFIPYISPPLPLNKREKKVEVKK